MGPYYAQPLAASAAKRMGESPHGLLQGVNPRGLELSKNCFCEFLEACKTNGSCTPFLPKDTKHMLTRKRATDLRTVIFITLAKLGSHKDALCKAQAELFNPNAF